MFLEIFTSILTQIITDPIKNYIVDPIKRHTTYAFTCDNNMERLQQEAQLLRIKKNMLQDNVDRAARNGEQIHDHVTQWLTRAEEDIGEAEQIIHVKEQAKAKCFIGLCPNLKTRYQLSKRADKQASAVDKVRNEERLDSISSRPPPKQKVAPSVYAGEALHSRMSILNEIMDALKDPSLNMIGVYGMGGVGKTTLAKEVHRQAQEDKLFEIVVLVAVSQTPDHRRIQKQIAEALGLDLVEEDMLIRANRLTERLKTGKILIILDDIWRQLQLEEVGIPSGDDCKGCKLLLTSRSHDVLSCQMRTQKDFKLEVLPEEEARSLFQKNVDDPQNPIAAKIAKKCAGLPLLILTVAMDLRNKDSYAWNDKLTQLSVFGDQEIQAKVHSVLQTSYDNLRSDELKSLFLLCGLFGQSNIRIQHLLMYSIGLGLFKQRAAVESARNRLLTLIDDLKAASLLLDGDMDGFVKMHDVVRDTAMSIASRVQHAFIGSSELKEWPEKDCTRISLPYNEIGELSEGWKCPIAELLFVFTEDFSFKISDAFFEGIRELKVLDFTGIHFESLPSSLSLLTNLHALCLHRGQLDNVDIIGGLKQLEVLSFAESHIVELPREIERLTQLKLLDLSNCSKLKAIPANIFSKLSLLEALYMKNSFVEWEADEINGQGNASLVELQPLSRLTTLEMQVLDAKIMPKSLFLNLTGLKNYRIVIGEAWDWSMNNESSTTLKLSFNTSIQREHGIKKLLTETEELYLDEVRGIENVLYDLDGDGFPLLKHLHVQNDALIQHIINSTKRSLCPPAFPILHSLFLDNLSNLEDICHGQLATDSFGKLKVLQVEDCKRLISLFSVCRSREEDHVNVNRNEVVELTQLCSLTLNNLPQLRSFCKEKDEVGASVSVFNRLISLPNLEDLKMYSICCENIWQDHRSGTSSNLTSLIVSSCHNLKHLFAISIVKSLLHLKKLEVSNCSSMEEIMLTEESPEEEQAEMMTKIQLFLKLDIMRLQSLPKLIRFCTAWRPIEFQSLRELCIRQCPALTTFVHCYTKRTNDNKRSSGEAEQVNSNFKIQSLFDGMVQFSNLEEMILGWMHNLKSIWHSQLAPQSFCKLKSLRIQYCPKLSIVFPPDVLPRFHTLEKLDLEICHSLQEIFQFLEAEINDVVAFKLRELRISGLHKLKLIWSKDPQTDFTFQELKSIHVFDCEVLKYICPASIARGGLLQLQQLEIKRCGGVEEIVSKTEDGAESEQPYFKFPELTSLILFELPKMKSLYGGRYRVEWPKLKRLDVRSCNKAMKFGYYDDGEGLLCNIPSQPLFMLEKDNHNLEELTLRHKDLLMLQHAQFPTKYCFSKIKVLRLLALRDQKYLFGFLKTLYNLEKLVVDRALLEEELFLEETFKILAQLKHLEISHCYDLKHILKSLIQNKHTSSCLFQNLATVEVSSCSKLKSLMTVSIAKAMVQLKTLRVWNCYMMTQVVENDGEYHSEDEIITFSKLKILKLEDLSHLTSFCSGNHDFSLPVLEEVIVNGCPQMKIFSYGVSIAPKLRSIRKSQYSNEQFWEGNLNATIASFLTKQISDYFQLSKYPELQNIWHNQHLGRRFHNVEVVTVDECEIFTKAISSNLLQSLNRLTELEVKGCVSVVEVFDLEGLSIDEGHGGLLPRLNQLCLVDLPMLRHLWNKDPKGILELKNLKSVEIDNCSSLKYVFTQTEATCLVQLQEVKLKNCHMMKGLIKKDEAEASHSTLPSLESIVLECLPNFTSLCPRNGNLECPALKKIAIYNCPNVKAFYYSTLSTMEQGQESNGEWGQKTSVFSHKVISNLEELSLDSKSIGMILDCELLPELFSNVKVVKLCFCTPKSCFSLFGFLQRLPNLENLVVKSCAIKELFLFEDAMVLPFPRIRALKLNGVNDLKNIWKTSSLLQSPLFEYLETLEVSYCEDLIDLAPSSASFQNLTTVKIWECNGLKNLFTPSVAKSLVQLATLTAESCVSLTEIVASEQSGIIDEIVFSKLGKLELRYLQSLTSFCLSSYTFRFPSLEEVKVSGCPNLRIFCPGDLKTPTLDIVEFEWRYHWEGNLNATIQHLYINMVGLRQVGDLTLSKFPMLKENWHSQFPFNLSLWRLVVDECASFSNALPSNLLQHFKQLSELVVEKCNSLEEVFDLKGLNADEADDVLMRNLKELHLIDLPMLMHVWNKDPEGILGFKNLTLLKLQNCSQLTHIFTLSIALGLENLRQTEIKGCSSVEQIIIVGDEEIAVWEDNKIKTIFPSLESMSLECLPSLLSFYCANGVLECPSLKIIDFLDCPKMNVFPPAEQLDSIMFVEAKKETLCKDVLVSPFLGSKVAIPSLEELRVEWNAMKNILWHEKFLSGLKALELRCFPGEFSLFESDFFQKFPNLEIRVVASDSFFREISEKEHPTSLLPPLKVTLSVSVSSFQNLTALEVSKCHGLINLMNASAATSLVQLKRMVIKDCETMQEIMAGTEGDDAVEDHEIGFGQLTFLGLEGLPCLTSFCSGNVAFNFPSLEKVIVRECTKMKTFAKQVFSGPKLWRVQTGKHEYEWEWEGSLNNTIQALFMEMSVEETR